MGSEPALERSEGVTRCDCSNGQELFFTIEPCLSVAGDDEKGIGRRWVISHRGCNLAKTESEDVPSTGEPA